MKFYDIGESPLMGHSEKCIAPLLLGGIIAAGASLAGNAIGSSSQHKTNETEAGDLETPAPALEPINGLRPREIRA